MEGSPSGASSDWIEVVVDAKPDKEEKEKEVAKKWAKLLRKYWGIRRLQCIFCVTGNYINESVSKECRERLKRTYREKK